MYQICDEQLEDAAAIETLLEICFGPDRFKKTAYKIRETLEPIAGLSLVAKEQTAVLASIRYWPILIGGTQEALLLGPIVVSPDRQGEGIGVDLIRFSMKTAKEAGHSVVVLVGDPEYYERFGFKSAFDAGLLLPGPVDVPRFLVAELVDGALRGARGLVSASPAFSSPCQA